MIFSPQLLSRDLGGEKQFHHILMARTRLPSHLSRGTDLRAVILKEVTTISFRVNNTADLLPNHQPLVLPQYATYYNGPSRTSRPLRPKIPKQQGKLFERGMAQQLGFVAICD
jgi:hypothetical protein